jgi:flagellar biosynthesis GTPase FlhF
MEVLNKVKEALGMHEVSLEERKLENGTTLEAEKFEAEQPVFIVTDDEKVALPMGKYEMEDGKTLVVEEEGIISEIADAISDAKEETEEVEAEAEEKEEGEEEMGYVTKEELGAAVEEIKAMIEDMRKEVEAGYGKKEEELSEVEEEKAELQEQLSQAATKPFAHSPEKTSVKREQIKFAQKRPQTTLDIVLKNLNK